MKHRVRLVYPSPFPATIESEQELVCGASMIFFTATEAISFICEQEQRSCFAPVPNADLVEYAESLGWNRPSP